MRLAVDKAAAARRQERDRMLPLLEQLREALVVEAQGDPALEAAARRSGFGDDTAPTGQSYVPFK